MIVDREAAPTASATLNEFGISIAVGGEEIQVSVAIAQSEIQVVHRVYQTPDGSLSLDQAGGSAALVARIEVPPKPAPVTATRVRLFTLVYGSVEEWR